MHPTGTLILLLFGVQELFFLDSWEVKEETFSGLMCFSKEGWRPFVTWNPKKCILQDFGIKRSDPKGVLKFMEDFSVSL